MKSINEKAEEVFLSEEYDSLETKLQRRKMRLCYEHGANYVLEAVKDILFRRYSDDGDPKQRWIDMKELIKALER